MIGNRWTRLALSVAIVAVVETPVGAVPLTDNFSSNPFPNTWCERYHHMHWGGSSNQLMLGYTATGCDSNGGCCLVCSSPGSREG